jgi:hypothetical protein
MERYRLSEEESFEVLRYNARSQRRKLIDVASEIIHAAESINLLVKLNTQNKSKKPRYKNHGLAK